MPLPPETICATPQKKPCCGSRLLNLSIIVVAIKNAAQETQAAFMLVQEEPSARPAPNKATSSAQKKTAPTITEMADQFIYRDKTKSPGIIRDTGKTIGLFVEAFGDKLVEQITGGMAGEFRDMLFALPSTHGKHKNSLGIHDAIVRAKEQELETLSGKTVKNHFSRLSALWGTLYRRDNITCSQTCPLPEGEERTLPKPFQNSKNALVCRKV